MHYGCSQASIKVSLKFSRAKGGTPDSTKSLLLFQACSLISLQDNSFVKKKRELFLGPHLNVFEFSCAATQYPPPACGILTFRSGRCRRRIPLTSGSSHSWPSADLMKPFSTSVFKVLILIVATTTKICTKGCSSLVYTMPSARPSRPSTCSAVFKQSSRVSAGCLAISIFRFSSFGRWVFTPP